MLETKDDESLDGCDLDYAENPTSDAEVDLLCLFPDGVADPNKWKGVFND